MRRMDLARAASADPRPIRAAATLIGWTGRRTDPEQKERRTIIDFLFALQQCWLMMRHMSLVEAEAA